MSLTWIPLLKRPPNIRFSMVVFKISPVIPTDTLWFAMLFLIGILGLIAQVCSLVLLFSMILTHGHPAILKTLLVMGLQRETASRGTLATYTSVRLFTL